MSEETLALRKAADYLYRAALYLGIMAEEADAGAAVPAHQRREALAALEDVEAQARLVRPVIARLR